VMSDHGEDLLHERINIRGEIENIRAVLGEREKLLAERFRAQETANSLKSEELSRRLEVLNHAHEQAREKERDFIGREAFDTHVQRNQEDHVQAHRELEQTRAQLQEQVVQKAEALQAQVTQKAEALAKSLSDATSISDTRIKALENFQSKLLGIALAAPFVTGLVVYLITR